MRSQSIAIWWRRRRTHGIRQSTSTVIQLACPGLRTCNVPSCTSPNRWLELYAQAILSTPVPVLVYCSMRLLFSSPVLRSVWAPCVDQAVSMRSRGWPRAVSNRSPVIGGTAERFRPTSFPARSHISWRARLGSGLLPEAAATPTGQTHAHA